MTYKLLAIQKLGDMRLTDFHGVLMDCFTWINTWRERAESRYVAMAALHFRLGRSRVKRGLHVHQCADSQTRVFLRAQESRRS